MAAITIPAGTPLSTENVGGVLKAGAVVVCDECDVWLIRVALKLPDVDQRVSTPPPPRSQHMAEVLEQILAEQRKTNELLGEVAQALLMAKSDSLDAARLLSQTLPVRSALPQSSHPQKPA